MSAHDSGGFPWLWLYYRAIDSGLDDAAFWNHSARAVHLIVKQTQEMRASSVAKKPGAAQAMPQRQSGPVERVRLNRLPHP